MNEMLEPTPAAAGQSVPGLAVSDGVPAPARLRLGEILVGRGKLDPTALERTLRLQESNAGSGGRRERLGELLVTL